MEFERRIGLAEDAFDKSETIVDALMGTTDEPAPTLDEVRKLYEEHNEAGMTGMSPEQLRKHKNSRLSAIE
ncbi:hypothetical protein [Rhizobium sp. LjRoot258]|uniref:hypothetical protein n=1 Tax=Rhizobium sp. LjRoot258 TaxID=3342299 RepID=UPI003ECF1932